MGQESLKLLRKTSKSIWGKCIMIRTGKKDEGSGCWQSGKNQINYWMNYHLRGSTWLPPNVEVNLWEKVDLRVVGTKQKFVLYLGKKSGVLRQFRTMLLLNLKGRISLAILARRLTQLCAEKPLHQHSRIGRALPGYQDAKSTEES